MRLSPPLELPAAAGASGTLVWIVAPLSGRCRSTRGADLSGSPLSSVQHNRAPLSGRSVQESAGKDGSRSWKLFLGMLIRKEDSKNTNLMSLQEDEQNNGIEIVDPI